MRSGRSKAAVMNARPTIRPRNSATEFVSNPNVGLRKLYTRADRPRKIRTPSRPVSRPASQVRTGPSGPFATPSTRAVQRRFRPAIQPMISVWFASTVLLKRVPGKGTRNAISSAIRLMPPSVPRSSPPPLAVWPGERRCSGQLTTGFDVGVGAGVGETVGAAVGGADGVSVGGALTGAMVGSSDAVGEGVGLGVRVGLGEGVGEALADAVGVGGGVAVGV